MKTAKPIQYSIIVLLEETEEGFHDFITLLHQVFTSRDVSFEILIMANGTEGFLKEQLSLLEPGNGGIKAFAFNKKVPQAVCLKTGLNESIGRIIMVCGSYQQITTDSFYDVLDGLEKGIDVITPSRKRRVDPSFNQLQSKIFNWLARLATGSTINDLSCTVKLFRREVLENIEIYGNMYRFLPILAERKGYKNKEVLCGHHQERGQTGFYRFSEYLSRLIDLFTIFFTTRFAWKPLRFFSAVGATFVLGGLGVLTYVLLEKLVQGVPIGQRPLVLLGLLLAMVGIQAAGIGLLGEIVIFTYGRSRQQYDIEKTL
jgi:hypothetical protein